MGKASVQAMLHASFDFGKSWSVESDLKRLRIENEFDRILLRIRVNLLDLI